mmetsp:Transcript_16625/g.15926  ORF Transcript_16625/g.15926 Transcript_16625/m.15926 type:complete len:82 (+) Transcript_16625:208-453(+)
MGDDGVCPTDFDAASMGQITLNQHYDSYTEENGEPCNFYLYFYAGYGSNIFENYEFIVLLGEADYIKASLLSFGVALLATV